MNINKVPYVIKFKKDPLGGCDIETPTDEIDIEKLRLTPLLNIPNITLEKGDSGGSIPNGSARVAIAYSEPLFRITDYLAISDVVFLQSQTTPNGSLRLTVENTDNNFKLTKLF